MPRRAIPDNRAVALKYRPFRRRGREIVRQCRPLPAALSGRAGCGIDPQLFPQTDIIAPAGAQDLP
jgi:hypothetical protein